MAASFEQPHGPTPRQEFVPEEGFGTAGQEPVATFTQDRKVEARVRQLETQEIRPVDARPDGLHRLAIRQVFPKWQERHQRQPPRGQARLARRGEQGRNVLVLKDNP